MSPFTTQHSFSHSAGKQKCLIIINNFKEKRSFRVHLDFTIGLYLYIKYSTSSQLECNVCAP